MAAVSKIKALEYDSDSESGKRFALSISVPITSIEDFFEQMPFVKEIYMEWLRNRQDDAAMFYFGISAEPELHTEIDGWIKKIYQEEEQLSPLLHAVDFHVNISNLAGDKEVDYVLAGVPR